jgi:hypothetical protein
MNLVQGTSMDVDSEPLEIDSLETVEPTLKEQDMKVSTTDIPVSEALSVTITVSTDLTEPIVAQSEPVADPIVEQTEPAAEELTEPSVYQMDMIPDTKEIHKAESNSLNSMTMDVALCEPSTRALDSDELPMKLESTPINVESTMPEPLVASAEVELQSDMSVTCMTTIDDVTSPVIDEQQSDIHRDVGSTSVEAVEATEKAETISNTDLIDPAISSELIEQVTTRINDPIEQVTINVPVPQVSEPTEQVTTSVPASQVCESTEQVTTSVPAPQVCEPTEQVTGIPNKPTEYITATSGPESDPAEQVTSSVTTSTVSEPTEQQVTPASIPNIPIEHATSHVAGLEVTSLEVPESPPAEVIPMNQTATTSKVEVPDVSHESDLGEEFVSADGAISSELSKNELPLPMSDTSKVVAVASVDDAHTLDSDSQEADEVVDDHHCVRKRSCSPRPTHDLDNLLLTKKPKLNTHTDP